MENTQNRNDIHQFFKDMPEQMQQEVINKLNKQIKNLRAANTLLKRKVTANTKNWCRQLIPMILAA